MRSVSDLHPSAVEFGKKIEVRFQGVAVPRLTLTKVSIWNSGTTTIRGTDVVESDGLRIEVGHTTQVLDASVEAYTRRANGIALSPQPEGVVSISLDYLDRGDGACIAVIHTGEDIRPRLRGTVRGLPRGWDYQGSHDKSRRATLWPVLGSFAIVVGIFAVAAFGPTARAGAWVLCAYALLGTALIFGRLLQLAHRRPPSQLEEHRGQGEDDGAKLRRCVTCQHRRYEHAIQDARACEIENCGCKGFVDASTLGFFERPPWK